MVVVVVVVVVGGGGGAGAGAGARGRGGGAVMKSTENNKFSQSCFKALLVLKCLGTLSQPHRGVRNGALG